jgi:hypothetical protein
MRVIIDLSVQRLEVNQINLNDEIIYIPSTARSNRLKIKLSHVQIISLHSNIHGGTRDKLKLKGDDLLPGNLHNTFHLLTEDFKGINPRI